MKQIKKNIHVKTLTPNLGNRLKRIFICIDTLVLQISVFNPANRPILDLLMAAEKY